MSAGKREKCQYIGVVKPHHWKKEVSEVQGEDRKKGINLRILSTLPISFRLLRVLIEQTGITHAAANRWNVRRIDILLEQSFPGDFGEPRVLHDVSRAADQVSKAMSEIGGDEFGEEILGVRVDVGRVFDAALEDVFVDF
jgi:hypothetical protein